MAGSCSYLDVVSTDITALSASALIGSNWTYIMTVCILNPLLLWNRLTCRRDCTRVSVFALVICSDSPKPMCWDMVIKNCTPLTKTMSAHRFTMIYLDLIKVGKEDNFCGLTADGVFLCVLPCSDWMLGPRISSATLTSYLVMGQFFSSRLSTICSSVLVLELPMVCWNLRAL